MTTDALPRHSYASGKDHADRFHDRLIQAWLFVIAGMVFAMVVVGGATRLTDSGLSITEWQPILGIIPPFTHVHWLDAFEKYKQIPEYHEVNAGMSLAEFEFIYWWEWSHRFLGRMIGIVFALPLAVFWWKGWVRPAMLPKLLGLFALGGLQGFIGWYMVQSGLSERVDVSHYRLALHLTTAFLILATAVWLALDVTAHESGARIRLRTIPKFQFRLAWVILALMFLQVILGAFVAGLKAGLTYNTWPLMDGKFIPDGLFTLQPWWMNFLENITTVQFDHRITAYLLTGLVIWHAVSIRRHADDERVARSATIAVLAVLTQAGLGIWTLLAAGEAGHIPIWLGLIHQGGAALVLGVLVWHVHGLVHSGRR